MECQCGCGGVVGSSLKEQGKEIYCEGLCAKQGLEQLAAIHLVPCNADLEANPLPSGESIPPTITLCTTCLAQLIGASIKQYMSQQEESFWPSVNGKLATD